MRKQISFILLLAVFIISSIQETGEDANSYYVDKNSINKGTYKWTMSLKNHHFDSSSENSADNPEIQNGAVILESLDKNVLHFKLYDKDKDRWEAPLVNEEQGDIYKKAPMDQMGVTFTEDPFSIKIVDPESQEVIMDSSPDALGSLKFYDKRLEFGYQIQNDRIFGWGERVSTSFSLCVEPNDYCTYTTFNKDDPSPEDRGYQPGGKNIYGHQPFYMVQQKSGKFFGVLFLNSNDQDLVIKKDKNGIRTLYHKPIGGIFDFYFFYAGSVDMIVKKYHSLIGRPYLPAMWALGYHQCRYGWKTLHYVKDVVSKLEQADIPLEVLWLDIDYMDEYRDFTVDPERYGGLGDYIKDLHRRQIKFVPIIDAGIYFNPEDPYYKKGEEKGVYIKSAWTKKSLCGKVWPGTTVFPDWYHPYMTTHWHTGLEMLYQQAQFDGIWIDMNEASNMVNGEKECKQDGQSLEGFLRMHREKRPEFSDPHDPHEFDDLPYWPGQKDPNEKALSMTGYHYASNDFEDSTRKEYNVHSLFGLYEAIATKKFFVEKQQKRPFVLTRSQFPGSGKFTSLWLGDNWSRWEYMRYSVSGMYWYQLFGMPFVGADMCGFMDTTTEELCARWMQMGAFYPFTRNHNDIHAKDQEPYLWDSVAKASRNAIRQKYSILRYYYTKMFEVSLNGGLLVKPTYFDHPLDEGAYTHAAYMWLIGDAIMVCPVLHENANNKVYPYVTNENWFDFRTLAPVNEYDPERKEGKQLEMDAPLDYVNLLMQGGNIVTFQDALKEKIRRTAQLILLPMDIIIAPDHTGSAQGTIYVDNEQDIDPISAKNYRYYKLSFSFESQKLSVEILQDYKDYYTYENVNEVKILGASKWANYKKATIHLRSGTDYESTLTYTDSTKVLVMRKPQTQVSWKDVSYVTFSQ